MTAAPSAIEDFKNLSPLAGVYPVTPTAGEPGLWTTNPITKFLSSVSTTISEHRKSLDLVNPGVMENINKEVSKDVFLSLYQFTGLKADINKTFAMNPVFQVAHSFAVGSKLPAYSFTSLIANDQALVQGTIDNELSLTGRLNYSWDKHVTSKVSVQLAHGQQSMCQLEHEYLGNDFAIQLKALNPDFTGANYNGLLIGSLMQSITPKLAVGIETVYNAMDPNGPASAAISLAGRYNAEKWIAAAQLQAQGAIVGSFWRKVAPNVEVGLETTIQASQQPVMSESMMPHIETKIEGNTVLGAKYEFRQSIYRGQLESNGDVSFMLEHRILPTIGLVFNGSINQFKNTSKLGCGIQIETAGSEQIMMMQNGMVDANGNPIQGAPGM